MCIIISLEGNIGSGKSTCINYLKNKLLNNDENINIHFVQEPVDEWNEIKDSGGESILEKFYADQEGYAFSFQIMAYITRLRKMLQIIEHCNNNSIVVCERSLETDKYVFAKMLYDNKKIRDIDWCIYNYWFNTFLEKIKTNLIIYIQTSPENCHKRIIKRNRKGEENIPLEYLQSCHIYHETWLKQCDVQIQILDGNIDMNNEIQYNHLLNSVEKTIYNVDGQTARCRKALCGNSYIV